MTEVTRHPNCRCGAEVGDNAYCPIHGRIRDMDAGASPFIDVDALAGRYAREMGIEEEDIDRESPVVNDAGEPSISEQIKDRDMEAFLNETFNNVREQIPENCKCTYGARISGMGAGTTMHEVNPECPIHGAPARREYDVDSTAEEIDGTDS